MHYKLNLKMDVYENEDDENQITLQKQFDLPFPPSNQIRIIDDTITAFSNETTIEYKIDFPLDGIEYSMQTKEFYACTMQPWELCNIPITKWLECGWEIVPDKKEKEKPWLEKNLSGESPGDICCQRATGKHCYEHDSSNY